MRLSRVLILFLASFLVARARGANLPVPDPDNCGLVLPPGFRAVLAAENYLGGRKNEALRFLAVAPNGDLYGKSRAEGILAFRDGAWEVRTTGPQGSGILSSMVAGNCLIVLDEDRGDVAPGELVEVEPFTDPL